MSIVGRLLHKGRRMSICWRPRGIWCTHHLWSRILALQTSRKPSTRCTRMSRPRRRHHINGRSTFQCKPSIQSLGSTLGMTDCTCRTLLERPLLALMWTTTTDCTSLSISRTVERFRTRNADLSLRTRTAWTTPPPKPFFLNTSRRRRT